MSTTAQKVRTMTGKVTSAKRKSTITVKVEWSRRHPTYGKVVKKFTTCHVHDQGELAKEGDLVEIKPSKPYSKTKTWELVGVIGSASQ
jgi:small subunit ribosomal protein S17